MNKKPSFDTLLIDFWAKFSLFLSVNRNLLTVYVFYLKRLSTRYPQTSNFLTIFYCLLNFIHMVYWL